MARRIAIALVGLLSLVVLAADQPPEDTVYARYVTKWVAEGARRIQTKDGQIVSIAIVVPANARVGDTLVLVEWENIETVVKEHQQKVDQVNSEADSLRAALEALMKAIKQGKVDSQ